MTLLRGDPVVRDELSVQLSAQEYLEEPPFTEWVGSRLPRGRMAEILEGLQEPLETALEPRGGFTVVRRGETDLHTRAPPDPLLEATSLGCVVATVGEPSPTELSMVEETVFDAMANVVLRVVKRRLVEELVKGAEDEGWQTTRLFSPGSGNVDWEVEHSALVLRHAPAEALGISRTESGLLRPTKSVASVIGLGPDVQGVPDPFSCEGCPRIDTCDYARLTASRADS